MISDRGIAKIAGVLFIIATAASLLSTPFLASISSSTYLVDVSANATQVATGAFLAFVAAAASASIAVSMYPVLRRHHEGLALGAVGFRLLEGGLYIVSVVLLLSLVTLSQEFVKAGAPGSSDYQTMGVVLLAEYRWMGNVGSLLAFCLGAFLYYYIFYQTRLVPRWLSGWGLVAIALLVVAVVSVMFGLIGPLSTFQVVLALPIAVQEMALAVWLIVKGFDASATASGGRQHEARDPS
jgi:hypothetical protein